jgi:putative chitinase
MIQSLQQKLGLKADGNLGPITAKKFGLTHKLNKFELAHFMGQCHHESNGFTRFSENLNYSAPRLLQIFPKYFNKLTAMQYQRNQQKIANKVYANRMGNGDEASGDGWKYRGRGPLQLTGKNNYIAAGKYLNIDLVNNPDLAIEYGFEIALWFFRINNIFELCKDVSNKTIELVTKKVNGGKIGLDHRIESTKKYLYD